VVVADKQAFETTHKLSQFWFEMNQTFMRSAFDIQDRSLIYVTDTVTDGIGTIQSNIEASQRWLQIPGKPQEQQEAIPSIMDSGVDMYKRNVDFMRRSFERWAETMRANVGSMRNLTQTWIQKAQEL
jgi:hypothetical protein